MFSLILKIVCIIAIICVGLFVFIHVFPWILAILALVALVKLYHWLRRPKKYPPPTRWPWGDQ
jgi:hypothetical protein